MNDHEEQIRQRMVRAEGRVTQIKNELAGAIRGFREVEDPRELLLMLEQAERIAKMEEL